ncbi:MAG: hypothetical protein RLN85_09600, partial [Pseudomonadales bacterium]
MRKYFFDLNRLPGLLLLFVGLSVYSANAQGPALKTLRSKKAVDLIKLDGVLDEESWQNAEMAVDFWQIWPADSTPAKTTTEVKITYDDKFLYVGAKMYNYNDKKYLVNSLRRDFQGAEIDGFHVNFDTFYDNNNAINFAVN